MDLGSFYGTNHFCQGGRPWSGLWEEGNSWVTEESCARQMVYSVGQEVRKEVVLMDQYGGH